MYDITLTDISQLMHVWLHCVQLITWQLLLWKALEVPGLRFIQYRYAHHIPEFLFSIYHIAS